MSWKVCCGSTTACREAELSMRGAAVGRARRRRVKLCSSMRYEAISDLPAQMPMSN